MAHSKQDAPQTEEWLSPTGSEMNRRRFLQAGIVVTAGAVVIRSKLSKRDEASVTTPEPVEATPRNPEFEAIRASKIREGLVLQFDTEDKRIILRKTPEKDDRSNGDLDDNHTSLKINGVVTVVSPLVYEDKSGTFIGFRLYNGTDREDVRTEDVCWIRTGDAGGVSESFENENPGISVVKGLSEVTWATPNITPVPNSDRFHIDSAETGAMAAFAYPGAD